MSKDMRRFDSLCMCRISLKQSRKYFEARFTHQTSQLCNQCIKSVTKNKTKTVKDLLVNTHNVNQTVKEQILMFLFPNHQCTLVSEK